MNASCCQWVELSLDDLRTHVDGKHVQCDRIKSHNDASWHSSPDDTVWSILSRSSSLVASVRLSGQNQAWPESSLTWSRPDSDLMKHVLTLIHRGRDWNKCSTANSDHKRGTDRRLKNTRMARSDPQRISMSTSHQYRSQSPESGHRGHFPSLIKRTPMTIRPKLDEAGHLTSEPTKIMIWRSKDWPWRR